jgi:(1->4)-alpha-D-glucan 1-alpha-D-glucosylmutase
MTPSEHENFIRRIQDYLRKATKEAKLRTSWISPYHRHDEALAEFVHKVLEPNENNTFLADFVNFREPLAMAGMLNSLSQTLLKIGSPGVPDFYQGTELWDDSLVDPDNRRPIDFEIRRVMLAQIVRDAARDPLSLAERLTASPRDGRIKMYIIRCALQFRLENPELFAAGAYQPLEAAGERTRNVISFMRAKGDAHAIIVAGRFFMSLEAASNSFPKRETWADTALTLPREFASGRYRDIFTGRTFDSHLNGRARCLTISEVFAQMPIALLVPSA